MAGAAFVQLSHTPFAAYTELGRAEAIGSLARIFCAVRTHESVLQRYLARFYICVHYALKSVEVCISRVPDATRLISEYSTYCTVK